MWASAHFFPRCPLLSFLANDTFRSQISALLSFLPRSPCPSVGGFLGMFQNHTSPPSCLELSWSPSRSSFHPGSETALKEFWHRKEHETSQSKRLTLEVGKPRFRSGLIAQCYCDKLNTPRPQGPCLPCAPLFVAPVKGM